MFDYDAIIVGGGRRGLRPASIFAAAATVAFRQRLLPIS